MKKFGLICLVLVLSLGAVGIGYAMWSDEIYIEGTVNSGSVCLGIQPLFYAEINNCPPSEFAARPDLNWGTWEWIVKQEGCPPGYSFEGITCTNKDVADMTFTAMTADGTVIPKPWEAGAPVIEKLKVTIQNAYPHYLGCFTFHIYNCGTIPIHVQPAVIEQDPFLLIEYYNGVHQLEPGGEHEISLCVGVVQHKGYWGTVGVPESWIVDDLDAEMLPMDAGGENPDYPQPLSFTISITALQWAE